MIDIFRNLIKIYTYILVEANLCNNTRLLKARNTPTGLAKTVYLKAARKTFDN